MKKTLIPAAALLLLLISYQASADVIVYCDNSDNENESWSLVYHSGWHAGLTACLSQGGQPRIKTLVRPVGPEQD